MVLRKMISNDFKAVEALVNRYFTPANFSREIFDSYYLNADQNDARVATLEDTFVGISLLEIASPPKRWQIGVESFDRADTRLRKLAVVEEFWHRRIAEALLLGAFGAARARRGDNMALYVHQSNTPAIALYRKHGFVETGECVPNRPENIVMLLTGIQARFQSQSYWNRNPR